MGEKKNHDHIIEQVPLDYYQKGVVKNFFQRKWHIGKLNAVLSEIETPPLQILDVGSASGWFLNQLQKRYPHSACFGIDIYKEAVKYGNKRYSKMKLSVADAHALPYKADSFDLVVCTEVLEHVDDPSLVLLEIKRVLKRDGRAIIELDSGSILFALVWFFWKLSKGAVWKHSHLHSFTVKKLEKLIKKSGFQIRNKKKFNFGMAMVFSLKKP